MLDNPGFGLSFLNSPQFAHLVKIGFIGISILYFIFSLVVIRQVNLMSETVITEAAGTLKIIAILHALLALIIVIFFAFFF